MKQRLGSWEWAGRECEDISGYTMFFFISNPERVRNMGNEVVAIVRENRNCQSNQREILIKKKTRLSPTRYKGCRS